MRRVLVTRPEPGAARTAERLRALGFEPLVLPLSETRELAVEAAPMPDHAAAVAITSANALRHAPAALIDRLAALPCHVVGERTAAAARAAGFRFVHAGPGDAAALADTVAAPLASKLLVYLCGRERFRTFEDSLAAAGVQLMVIETYDTVAVEHSDQAVLSLFGGRPADAILLYSVKAAQATALLGRRAALRASLANAEVFSLSTRIGAAFAAAGGARGGEAYVAPRPDEEALLALLRAWR